MNFEDSQDLDMSSHNTSTEIVSGNEKAVNLCDLDETRMSQHNENDTDDTEPLINKYNISNTSTKKKMSNYGTENESKTYVSDSEMEVDVSDEVEKKVKNNFDEVDNPQPSTSGNNAFVSDSESESDEFDNFEEKNGNNFNEIDNPQPSTSGNNAFVTDTESESDEFDNLEEKNGNNFNEIDNPQPSTSGSNVGVDIIRIPDDLLINLAKKTCFDEPETARRPRRLMLNDDKKRIFKKSLGKTIKITSPTKRTFKRTVKRNCELGNSKYMPGPKSMTKDLDYHLQELSLATRLPMPVSEGPYSPSLKITCYELSGNRTRVLVSWNMKVTPSISKIRTYEFYLCKDFVESRLRLSWTRINLNERPKTLTGRCIVDVKRGFTYHFGLRTVKPNGRLVPFSVTQKWI